MAAAIDDPIGAVAVHGFCGIWGTWALGLFATGQFGTSAKGAVRVSGAAASSSSWAQIWGNAVVAVVAFVVAMVA